MVNSLSKKQFHKEAIRVEEMPPVAQSDPKEPWLVDHTDWDPLSSGEGDLLSDDMAIAFAASGNVSQSVRGLGFPSLSDSVQSHGLQVNNVGTGGKLSTSGNFFATPKDIEVSTKTEMLQDEPTSCATVSWINKRILLNIQQEVFPDFPMTSTDVEGFDNSSTITLQELRIPDVPETFTSLLSLHESKMQNRVSISDSMKIITSKPDDLDVGCLPGSRTEVLTISDSPNHDGAQTNHLELVSSEWNRKDAGMSSEMQFGDITLGVSLPGVTEDPLADKKSSLHARNAINMDSVIVRKSNNGLLLCDRQPLEEVDERKEHHNEVKKDTAKVVDGDAIALEGPFYQKKDGNDHSLTESLHSDDLMTEYRKQVQEIGTKSK